VPDLSWKVQGIREVYYQGQPTVGQRRAIMPGSTHHTTCVFQVSGVEDNRYITGR